MEKRLIFGVLNFRVVEEWWLLPRSKVCFLLFSSLAGACVFWSFFTFVVFSGVLLLEWVPFLFCVPLLIPLHANPTARLQTFFCTLRFYFAHLIGSAVTLTAQRLWHILTLDRSLPSPLCLFTSPSLSALALCLSAVVSLCSGPIRRPAVDPESLESGRFSLSDDVLVVHFPVIHFCRNS